MGTSKSKSKRDGGEKPKTVEDLLQECQGLTKRIVRDVVDLLGSFDYLHASSRKLHNDILVSVDKDGSTENISDFEKCKCSASHLLYAAEEIQSDTKQTTIETLRKFLQFIKKVVVECEIECSPGCFGEELLHKYMNGLEIPKMTEDRQTSMYHTRNQHKNEDGTKRYIEFLKREVIDSQNEITDLKKKLETFLSEKKIINEKIKHLENESIRNCEDAEKMSNDAANNWLTGDCEANTSKHRSKMSTEIESDKRSRIRHEVKYKAEGKDGVKTEGKDKNITKTFTIKEAQDIIQKKEEKLTKIESNFDKEKTVLLKDLECKYESEKAELKFQLSQQTEQNRIFKKENEKLHTTLETAVENFNKVMTDLQTDVKTLKDERDKQKRHKETLQTQLDVDTNSFRQHLEKKEDTISDLTIMQDNMKINETNMNEIIKQKEEEIRKLNEAVKSAKDIYSDKIVQLETANATLTSKYEDMKQKKSKCEIEKENVAEMYEALKENLEKNDERIKDLLSIETELKLNIKEKEGVTLKLNKTLQKANDNFDKLLNKFENEKAMIISERDEKQRKIKELQIHLNDEIDNYKQQLRESETRTTTLSDECKVLEEEKYELEKKRDEAVQRAETLELQLTQKTDEYKLMNEQKNEKSKELNTIETKFNDIIKDKEKEIANVNKTLQTATVNFDKLINKFEDEKATVITERDEEKRQMKELQTKMTDEINNFRQQLQESETRKATLSSECKALEEEKHELKKERDEVVQRAETLDIMLTQKTEDYRLLNEQKNEKSKELNNLETKLNEIIKDKEKEIANLIRTLHTATVNFDKLMNKFEDEKATVILARDEEQRRKKEMQTKMNDEINNYRQQLQESKTRTATLEEEKRKLEKERDEVVQRNETLETQFIYYTNECKLLNEQKDEIGKELIYLETKLNKIIKENQEEIENLNITLQKATVNFDKLMNKFEAEKATIIVERDEEQRRMKELQTKMNDEIYNYRQQLQESETRTTTLTSECEFLKEEKRTLQEEKDKVVKINETLDTQLTQKAEECKLLNEQKDEKSSELISLETKLKTDIKKKEEQIEKLNKTLQNANDKMKKEETEYQYRLRENEQKINELFNLNERMQIQEKKNLEEYENKRKSLDDENQRLTRQLDMLRGELKVKADSAKKLLEEKQILNADILKKTEHIQTINDEHEKTKSRLTKDIKSITEAKLNEKNAMEVKERVLKGELKNANTTINSLNSQISKLQDVSKENERHISEMKTHIIKMEGEYSTLKTRLAEIAQNLEKSTSENKSMKIELERIKSRKVIEVQLYNQSACGLLSTVEDELKCVLKSKMDVEEGVDIDILCCAKASDIQPDIPLLILCIQASRLGTAVASTVQGLTLTHKMAVLIFHHKDVHALPNQASERVLTGQELRSLGGIFDLAFLSGKGIYTCEMNRANFVSLVNFIKREGIKRFRVDM